MDGQTITKLAKAHATLIMQYTGLSQVDAISLASQIIQYVAGGNLGAGEPAAYTGGQSQPAPQARPTGDQEAPGEGAILARPGHICTCSTCKAEVYEVITEVRGKGMGVNAFCQAFRPIGHTAALNREMLDVLKDANGNVYIDCPLCKGVKSLMLIGKYDTTNQKVGIAPVTSVRAGDF